VEISYAGARHACGHDASELLRARLDIEMRLTAQRVKPRLECVSARYVTSCNINANCMHDAVASRDMYIYASS
jgi:hypothetical protein